MSPTELDTLHATPDEAEEAYYDAFARADLQAMEDVWLQDDAIVCIHPMANLLRGRKSVLHSWRKILRHQGPSRIRFEPTRRYHGPVLAIHVGIEHVHHTGGHTQILATNIYQLTEHGWRMLVHHASPLPGAPSTTPSDAVH